MHATVGMASASGKAMTHASTERAATTRAATTRAATTRAATTRACMYLHDLLLWFSDSNNVAYWYGMPSYTHTHTHTNTYMHTSCIHI